MEPTPGPPVSLYFGLPAKPMAPLARDDVNQAVRVRSLGEIPPGAGHQVLPAGRIAPPETSATVPQMATAAQPNAPVRRIAEMGGEETLDLGVALHLAGVENPTINLAKERIQEAMADQLAAQSLLLPSVNIGGNYHDHSGNLQAGTGLIRNVNSQNLYLGFGAGAVGAQTVAYPGIRLFAHLGDAVYEPLAARQRVSTRKSDAWAVRNEVLLRVSTAYLELIGAEARLEVLRQGEVDVGEVIKLTRIYAEKGQGRQSDADRAAARGQLVDQELRRGEEEVAIASAHLCQLVSLDPSIRLRTPGGAVLPFRLIQEDAETEPLVVAALRARPEVSARSAEVAEAQVRVRQEKVRPLLPLVSVGYSGGLFGGGSNQVASDFGPLKGRSDFDAFAVWNFQGLGFGNRAQVRRADSVMTQTVARYDLVINQIRREVAEAQVDARAAARQIELAKHAVSVAEEGCKLETERIREFQGRPIEALDSFQQLLDSRQELVRAVVAFNIAQFRLFVAVGSTPLDGIPAATN